MAKLTLGKVEYDIPPFMFISLKKIWPLMQEVGKNPDPISNVEAMLGIFSEGLSKTDTPKTVDELENALLAAEILGFEATMAEIMDEAGLVVVKKEGGGSDLTALGEAGPAPEPSLSTEIGTDTSQSLSPPESVAETGTE